MAADTGKIVSRRRIGVIARATTNVRDPTCPRGVCKFNCRYSDGGVLGRAFLLIISCVAAVSKRSRRYCCYRKCCLSIVIGRYRRAGVPCTNVKQVDFTNIAHQCSDIKDCIIFPAAQDCICARGKIVKNKTLGEKLLNNNGFTCLY